MEQDSKAVLINCPTTGKPVKTGMFMNRQLFRKEVFDNREVKCPHCGKIHVWSKKDSHLAGE